MIRWLVSYSDGLGEMIVFNTIFVIFVEDPELDWRRDQQRMES